MTGADEALRARLARSARKAQDVSVDLGRCVARLAEGPVNPPRVLLLSEERRGRRRLLAEVAGRQIVSTVGLPADGACVLSFAASWADGAGAALDLPLDPAACPEEVHGPVEALRGVALVLAPRPGADGPPWLERLLPHLLLATQVIVVLNAEQPLSATERRWIAAVAPRCPELSAYVVGLRDLPETDRHLVGKRVQGALAGLRADARVLGVDGAEPLEELREALRAIAGRSTEDRLETWRERSDAALRLVDDLQHRTVPLEPGPPPTVVATEPPRPTVTVDDAPGENDEGGRWRECVLCGAWTVDTCCPVCGQSASRVRILRRWTGVAPLRVLLDLADGEGLTLTGVTCARAPWLMETGRVQAAATATLHDTRAEGTVPALIRGLVAAVEEGVRDALGPLADVDVAISVRLTASDPRPLQARELPGIAAIAHGTEHR